VFAPIETSTAPRIDAPTAAYALADVAPQVSRRESAEARRTPRSTRPSEHLFSFASSAVVKADLQVEVLSRKDSDPTAWPTAPTRPPTTSRWRLPHTVSDQHYEERDQPLQRLAYNGDVTRVHGCALRRLRRESQER
jgi:hypothetical protein